MKLTINTSKKIFSYLTILVFVLMVQCAAYAQDDEPRFPGCSDAEDVDCADMKMMQFVFSNLKHPEGNPGGEVVALFMVKASGELANVSIIESLTPDCDEEVTRIVKLMPNWLPAMAEGASTDMEWELVVKFIAK